VGVLIAFKIVTITLVLVVAHPADNLVALLVAMNWIWIVPIGLLVTAIPLGYWLRLVRARAKRRRLQHAEWHVA
jgi:sensor c-di-GMP phosphodiesterase-like protein